jgi:hypothetical protein
MSRAYQMNMIVRGYDPAYKKEIRESVNEVWGIEDEWDLSPDSELQMGYSTPGIYFHGEDYALYGGESEEEFTLRLSQRVWEANGGKYCSIEVQAIYLEEIPYECHITTSEQFEEWKKSVEKKQGEEA